MARHPMEEPGERFPLTSHGQQGLAMAERLARRGVPITPEGVEYMLEYIRGAERDAAKAVLDDQEDA